MAEHSSYETNKVYPNLSPNLSDDLQFRLNKINEIRDYFKERELMSKRPSKYIDFFLILTNH